MNDVHKLLEAIKIIQLKILFQEKIIMSLLDDICINNLVFNNNFWVPHAKFA